MYLKKSKIDDLKTFYTMSQQKHIGKHLNAKSLKEFENEFKDDDTLFLSVMSDENIAGYIILVVETESVQLKRIVIDENYLGIGSKVLLFLDNCCQNIIDKNELWLDVYADNKRAISLYEKFGYSRYSEGVENCREVWFYRKKVFKR